MASLYAVVFGQVLNATDINQGVNILQKASGEMETGSYYLGGWGSANGDLISVWMPTLSRNALPASVSFDTSVQTASNIRTPVVNNLDSNGFQIWAYANTAATNCHCAGHWTVQY